MEKAYLASIELLKNKADRTLMTWIESDSIRVDEMQELLDMPPADIPLISVVHRQEDLPLKSLSPSVDTEEKPRTNTANDRIFLEDYSGENQMWQPWKESRCPEV